MQKIREVAGRFALLAVLCAAGSAWAQTSTLTRVSSFGYDADGVLISETVEPDRPNDCLQTTYALDAFGNQASSSVSACAGASGHSVSSAGTARTGTASFQAHPVTVDGVALSNVAGMFPTSVTNALGHTENKQFDPRHGGVTRLVGPNGLATNWTYDDWGRKTRETRSDGTYTVWTYQLCQVSGQARDPLCPTAVGPHALVWYVSESVHAADGASLEPLKLQFHDALDRAVRTQTKDFHGQDVVQDTHYNVLGQIEKKSIVYRLSGGNPYWTTLTYDAIGRPLTETSPDGSGGSAVTQMAYSGLVSSVTNPLGQVKTTHKDASGNVAKVVDQLGGEVVYVHDALGQLLQTTASGLVTRLTYTQRGQKASMEDPAMGRWDYAYNAHGELVWQQDSLGQTATMMYDRLGRMVQRNEPDLISRWYFDAKADATACGLGVGKLCEATADNGYRRLHRYDAQGRPDRTETALDSSTSLAAVSQTYEPNTGRVVSQTWPTGYSASYTYTSAGFLSKVEGGGVAGHAQIVSLEVLAMDPQGRVTQYKQGNNVTTVRTYDQPTGKLNSVRATLQGQSDGNVLSHNYGFDKVGNLLTRSDLNTGVSESFQYDALNRLSLYTALGGGLSSVQSVQTLYDARGNLKYKSDVGYYHYDVQRPNRLNHVTLAPESNWSAVGSVTVANTGTRALSYAYDDSRAGARSIQANGASLSMGNGNLWYTVSEDEAHGRHTVRWESYTSFNMPRELQWANLGQDGEPATVSGYSCPGGYQLAGTNCTKTEATNFAATPVYGCPVGFTLSGMTCTRSTSAPATATELCPQPSCTYTAPNAVSKAVWRNYRQQEGWVIVEDVGLTIRVAPRITYSCPAGTTLSGSSCISVVTQAAAVTSYSCPAGATVSGNTCQGTTTHTVAAMPVYSCPSGSIPNGSVCSPGTPIPATLTGYTCPAGFTLNGTSCERTVVTPTSTPATVVYSCPAGYTLNGSSCTTVSTTAGTVHCAVPGATYNATYNRCERGEVTPSACPIWATDFGATHIGFEQTGTWEGEQIGKCLFTVVRICPSGYLVSGATCAQTLTQAAASSYTCPAGTTLSGASCQGSSTQVQTQAATPVYSCPAGLALNGNTCSDPTNVVADRKLTFTYGPEHQRVRQTVELTSAAPSHMEPGTTWYLNGTDSQGLTYEKTVQANGLIEHKHYVSVGSMTFALYVKREGSLNGKPATTVSYLHHDHLGSVAVVTNETGAVSERLAYDPWGKRRNVDGQNDVLDALYGVHTDRGYTMHEHLDEVGIIHMNGRLYDPLIGRFMSADPFIQHPDDLQSFNRYAYVLNNPLAYTDPSGYFSLKKFVKAHHKFWRAPTAKNLFKFISAHPGQAQIDNYIMTNEWAYSIGQIAATAFTAACGGCGGAIWASYYTYQSTGSISEAAKVGAIAYGTARAFTWAGGFGQGVNAYSLGHFGAHALVGCVSTVAQGGNCGTGALSAVAGLAGTPYGLPGSAVAGGLGSMMGGGKFADGMVMGAMGYLFNHCMHAAGCWQEAQESYVKAWRKLIDGAGDAVGMLTPGTSALDCISQGCSFVAATVAAADLIPGAGKGVSVAFKSAHAFRHVIDAGFDAGAVRAAIEADVVTSRIADSLAVGSGATRSVSVAGNEFRYHINRWSGSAAAIGQVKIPDNLYRRSKP